MKKLPKIYKQFLPAMLGIAALGMATSASAATVDVDPATMTNGFMAWTSQSNSPALDGAGGWGFADLTATHTPGVLTLGAAPIGDPDPYWYPAGGAPGAVGDKVMEATSYAQVPDGTFADGETVTFEFTVLNDTFVNGFSVKAFISDFIADFSYNETTFYDITSTGAHTFSQTLNALDGVTQWGFKVYGPNVWPTDVAAQGNIQIGAVPVPAAVWLFGSGLLGLVGVARRRKG